MAEKKDQSGKASAARASSTRSEEAGVTARRSRKANPEVGAVVPAPTRVITARPSAAKKAAPARKATPTPATAAKGAARKKASGENPLQVSLTDALQSAAEASAAPVAETPVQDLHAAEKPAQWPREVPADAEAVAEVGETPAAVSVEASDMQAEQAQAPVEMPPAATPEPVGQPEPVSQPEPVRVVPPANMAPAQQPSDADVFRPRHAAFRRNDD